MAFKFETCLACEICFYNHEDNCTMCKLCDGENMFQPIKQDEIDRLELALKTEDSKLRYYMDLNPTLKKSIDNCELTIVD